MENAKSHCISSLSVPPYFLAQEGADGDPLMILDFAPHSPSIVIEEPLKEF